MVKIRRCTVVKFQSQSFSVIIIIIEKEKMRKTILLKQLIELAESAYICKNMYEKKGRHNSRQNSMCIEVAKKATKSVQKQQQQNDNNWKLWIYEF